MAPQFGSLPVGETVVSCPRSTKPPIHWIEFELVGEDGKPIANETYRVTLPNGDVVTGKLDNNGFARIEGIEDSGECHITFPELDQEAWEGA